jgi:hypothetical protein
MNIDVMNLGNTIKNENQASQQDRIEAMIFLRYHLHDDFKKKKKKYLTIKDPLTLWNNLKKRYEHQKVVILPKAYYGWMHLMLHSLKSVHS